MPEDGVVEGSPWRDRRTAQKTTGGEDFMEEVTFASFSSGLAVPKPTVLPFSDGFPYLKGA